MSLTGQTFANQDKLPKLPVPPLEDTCRRYLRALIALQDEREHAQTEEAVKDFLENDGPKIQAKLLEWAKKKDRSVDTVSLDVDLVLICKKLYRRLLVTLLW